MKRLFDGMKGERVGAAANIARARTRVENSRGGDFQRETSIYSAAQLISARRKALVGSTSVRRDRAATQRRTITVGRGGDLVSIHPAEPNPPVSPLL